MIFLVECKSNTKCSGVYVQIDKHEWQHLNEDFNIWSQGVAYYFTEKEEILWFDFEKSPEPIYDDGDLSVRVQTYIEKPILRKSLNQIAIILDLDETLIYGSLEQPEEWDFKSGRYYIQKRPHIEEFLTFIFERFQCGIWTAAAPGYARDIVANTLEKWQQKRLICFHTGIHTKCKQVKECGFYSSMKFKKIKPLKKLSKRINCPLKQMLMIDNTPSCFEENYGNGILVNDFEGGENDNELLLLMRYLKKFRGCSNVRHIEKRLWRDMV